MNKGFIVPQILSAKDASGIFQTQGVVAVPVLSGPCMKPIIITMQAYQDDHWFVYIFVSVFTAILFQVIILIFWKVCERKEISFGGISRMKNKILQSNFTNFICRRM